MDKKAESSRSYKKKKKKKKKRERNIEAMFRRPENLE
jgi:hypothetical protein